MESPVLLVVFNRPDTTIQVFEAIRKFKVPKLYISADAPRKGNLEDEIKCTEVRQIVQNVDWDCDVHYRFLEKNVGCGFGVSSAISWAFEKEDRLIILEDDCVPAQPFFTYCDYLLEKYKDDTRIWRISGRCYHPNFSLFLKYDYIFTMYGHIWGWATWKRCWEEFDIDMKKLPIFLEERGFDSVFSNKKQIKYYNKYYRSLSNNIELKSHAWGPQAAFSVFMNRGLSIIPSRNLVKNIGIEGVHTKGKLFDHEMDKCESYKIEKEPLFVIPSKAHDEFHFRHHINYKKPIISRIKRKITKMFNKENIL